MRTALLAASAAFALAADGVAAAASLTDGPTSYTTLFQDPAAATDLAGNRAEDSDTCVVPALAWRPRGARDRGRVLARPLERCREE